MLLAYIIESLIKKTKRLKLVEVVQLLREVTNVEMDLRFEAAAANELYENTKNDIGFKVPKIYWNQTSKKTLCLDRINGTSIREVAILKSQNIDVQNQITKILIAGKNHQNSQKRILRSTLRILNTKSLSKLIDVIICRGMLGLNPAGLFATEDLEFVIL